MTSLDNQAAEIAGRAAGDASVAALVALAQHGITPDIQELLVRGNPLCGVPPGALLAAINAFERTMEAAVHQSLLSEDQANER